MGSIAALFGLLFVAASAAAAHLLTALTTQQLAWYDSASRMLGFHALALALLALQQATRRQPVLLLNWIGLAWIAGVLLFCGSLYAIALDAPRFVSSLAPIGGSLLMAGWLAWIWACRRLR